jgi:hypothetical protein
MSEHLSPEIFVDLLEGSPVEARWRRHLDDCPECPRELGELGETLDWVRSAETAPRRSESSGLRYLAAAAAVFLALGGLFFALRTRSPVAEHGVASEQLLPPIQQDDDFELLLALSRDLPDTLVVQEAVETGSLVDALPTDLTEEEQRLLLERLATEGRNPS